MIHVDFEFRLSRQAHGHETSVRIWTDENHDGEMERSEQVGPLRRDGLVWRGRRAIDAPSIDGMAFLVKFRAADGATWRLRVWTDHPERKLIYEETDVVRDGGGRVLGWCRS